MREPALALLDYANLYEVRTNASDFSIREVLMHDRKQVAFEIRKLNET